MPVRLEPPVEKEFVLERTDKLFKNTGDPTTIKVKQAREGDHMERMNLWREFKRTLEITGDISVTQSVSPSEVKRKEVYLTLIACNLQDDQGKDVFDFPLKEGPFVRAWATLPPMVADEIHEKVLEVNLIWSAEGESRS